MGCRGGPDIGAREGGDEAFPEDRERREVRARALRQAAGVGDRAPVATPALVAFIPPPAPERRDPGRGSLFVSV